MSEPREVPSEQEILETLRMLAEFSRVYWLMLQTAGPVIERLSLDDSLAAILLTTLATAIAHPATGPGHPVPRRAARAGDPQDLPNGRLVRLRRSEWC